jgi:sigma-B regulation protein RsbU (phosphoserine phosphatase)
VSLKEGVKNLGKGEFSVKVQEKGTQETVELAQVFNQLGSQLSEYMDNLKSETAAREAVESEIRIARDIQQSLLQKTFPPFPGHDEFELFALLEPAKEVAGDFYDYFFIDKKRLVVMVGDVSGKGVPAAFFMAITRTMLKNICQLEHDPGKVLKRVNDMLCEENDACMFVTVLLGIYDIETGELHYANGGHNEMLKLGSNGEFDKFGMLSNVALGVMPGAKFTTAKYQLEPNDVLALYTDGLIEAVGADEQLYGEERFRKSFKENSDLSVNFLAAAVIEDVTAFEQGQRFDDITLMILKRI